MRKQTTLVAGGISYRCHVRRPVMWLSTAVTLAWLSGCSQPGSASSPAHSPTILATAVVARTTALQMQALDIVPLQAQVNDRLGRPVALAPIDFRSEDERIAVVDDVGRVTSVGPAGSTVVLISSGAIVARVPVTVRAGPPVSITRTGSGPVQGEAGAVFEYGLTVRATDQAGNGVPEVVLTLRAEPAAGEPAPATTDIRGEASWTPALPAVAGDSEWVVDSGLPGVAPLRVPVRVLSAPAESADTPAPQAP